MNETELRDRLREVIASSSPPPMNVTTALDAAHRARGRRNAWWAGSAVATGVVLIAVGATVIMPHTPDPQAPGGAGTGTPAVTGTPQVTGAPQVTGTPQVTVSEQSANTETVMPTGPDGQPQGDRTAYSGPRADSAAHLLDELVAVVPAGYTPSQGPTKSLPDNAGPSDMNPSTDPWTRAHQAEFVDRVDGVEVWQYVASLAVHQGDAVGHLLIQVTTSRSDVPADLCEQARQFWSPGGGCTLVDVGGRQVAVLSPADPAMSELDQWAGYRHPDGTMVLVGQARMYSGAAAALPQFPFTTQQLAELATAERFHLQ